MKKSEYIESLDKLVLIDNNGREYWRARELYSVFGYSSWYNFNRVINRAKLVCEDSDNFVDTTKTVTIGRGVKRKIKDIILTRKACYFIAKCGHPRKKQLKTIKSYFSKRGYEIDTFVNPIDSYERKKLLWAAFPEKLDKYKKRIGRGELFHRHWYARDIQEPVYGYKHWRSFRGLIDKIKKIYRALAVNFNEHIIKIKRTIRLAEGVLREVEDFKLSTSACYLMALRADHRKKETDLMHAYLYVQAVRSEDYDATYGDVVEGLWS